jgi:hypothetical protein
MRFDDELIEALDTRANEEQRTRTNMATLILKKELGLFVIDGQRTPALAKSRTK